MRILCLLLCAATLNAAGGWPEMRKESRPWAYWWWMGGAVDAANLTRELERHRAAGMGGVHIIQIYGAKGYESRFIDYLSPKWMQMMGHAVKEAARLDMGVDMTMGSGWCFGGPRVKGSDACAVVAAKAPGEIAFTPCRQAVKRAGPGGAGPMLNPFQPGAIAHYSQWFDEALAGYNGPRPRAVYHDSFEYQANWSEALPREFEKRRGYKLEDHWAALFGGQKGDEAARVKSDYRETLSDLMVEEFAGPWVSWAKKNGMMTRNQAHGSPGNLLDLYAAVDIPETEMFNKDRSTMVSKLASSAAHVAGRKLVSSETGTWLKEHFTETLGDLKGLLDQLFTSGVNHVFYHGTIYSPDDAPWPGWLFYASTEMNPRNPIWHDAGALNGYIARVQSVLQAGDPDNDILLYWPLYDVWHSDAGMNINMTVHHRDWFEKFPVAALADKLWQRGWAFDFVSDRMLAGCQARRGDVVTAAGGRYRAIVVPATAHMSVATVRKLAELAKAGVSVIYDGALPADVPGWAKLDARRAELKTSLSGAAASKDVEAALAKTRCVREPMTAVHGLEFIRRAEAGGRWYFIANRSKQDVDEYVELGVPAVGVELLDPMTGKSGAAATRRVGGHVQVKLQLSAGASMVVRTLDRAAAGPKWPYWKAAGDAVQVAGPWKVKFVAGGPELPAEYESAAAGSWAARGGDAERFAGTAVYTAKFDAPAAGTFMIDLGGVAQSARVRVNGVAAGTAWIAPFRVVAEGVRVKDNLLEVEVTSTAANRVRDLDRREVAWKNFYDINFVNMDYKPFDASAWPVADAGLLGPVTLRKLTAATVQVGRKAAR